jgi:hypothetical protein
MTSLENWNVEALAGCFCLHARERGSFTNPDRPPLRGVLGTNWVRDSSGSILTEGDPLLAKSRIPAPSAADQTTERTETLTTSGGGSVAAARS